MTQPPQEHGRPFFLPYTGPVDEADLAKIRAAATDPQAKTMIIEDPGMTVTNTKPVGVEWRTQGAHFEFDIVAALPKDEIYGRVSLLLRGGEAGRTLLPGAILPVDDYVRLRDIVFRIFYDRDTPVVHHLLEFPTDSTDYS
jgi:hypothetical protein